MASTPRSNSPAPPLTGPINPAAEETPIPIVKIVLLAMVFAVACFYSARTGVRLAKTEVPGKGAPVTKYAVGAEVTLGRSGKAIYVADTTERLRQFYLSHPDEISRTEADMRSVGVRRLYGQVEVKTLRSLSDAVQVRVISGSIAGAIYWIHLSQLPSESAADTILSPIPKAKSR